jgi:biopolymer transport protein ExbB/TolQ
MQEVQATQEEEAMVKAKAAMVKAMDLVATELEELEELEDNREASVKEVVVTEMAKAALEEVKNKMMQRLSLLATLVST